VKKIAIIGSRRMSPYGKKVIGELMEELKDKAEVVTIAVAGCNREVVRLGAKKILAGENFEKLNKELADYADILVIVEGGEKSGTVLAAKNFLDLGKEVWAVPGRITDEGSGATNFLIANGAGMITKVENWVAGLV
jgi:predicted Rossmann fold nucleotide-binding protein DprA/Smf involved in DNA uptake